MRTKKLLVKLCQLSCLIPAVSMAESQLPATHNAWWLGAEIGTIENTNKFSYNSLTGTFPQNAQQTVNQLGYTFGLSLQWQFLQRTAYALGLKAAVNGNQATVDYTNATLLTSATSKLRYNIDLSLLPTFYHTEHLASFFEIGLSAGRYKNSLVSPVGTNPTNVTYSSSNFPFGVVLGAGLTNQLSNNIALTMEYEVHSYARKTLSAFQNFTADYTQTGQLYNQALVLGLHYGFRGVSTHD